MLHTRDIILEHSIINLCKSFQVEYYRVTELVPLSPRYNTSLLHTFYTVHDMITVSLLDLTVYLAVTLVHAVSQELSLLI